MKRQPDQPEGTPVLFRADREAGETHITAVFPCDPADNSGESMGCFAHVGQHSACSLPWYHGTRAATPEGYAALKRELEAAPYHYSLKVYARMQPWMRVARREALRRVTS